MMAEIIPFPCVQNEIADTLEALAAQARAERIKGVMIAVYNPDATITTYHEGVDMADRAVMLTHLQYDMLDDYLDE